MIVPMQTMHLWRANQAKSRKIPIDLMFFLGPIYVIFPLCGGSSKSNLSLFRNTNHLISMDPKKADSWQMWYSLTPQGFPKMVVPNNHGFSY